MTDARDGFGVHTVIGVDAGTTSLREADHLVHDLVDRLGAPPGTIGCTHLIHAGHPHTAVSLALPDADAAEAAWHRLTALLADRDEPPTGAALGDLRHGAAEQVDGAALAAAEQANRTGGRAVVYPGVQQLTGTVPLRLLLDVSAIERVTVLGAPSGSGHRPEPGAVVLTRDHVRPVWQAGELVLPLTPATGGLLAPFEVPNPTPCCADHY